MNYDNPRSFKDKKKLLIILAASVALIVAIILTVIIIFDNSVKRPDSADKNSVANVEQADDEAVTPVPEKTEDTDAAENAAENNPENESENDDEGIQIEIPVAELGKLVDKADDEYQSFDILPIDSADFFLDKKLRLVATLKEHSMSNYYSQDITSTFTEHILAMNYKDNDGKEQTVANYIYAVSKQPFTTEGGRNFVVVAFGDHEITEDNKEFSSDCLALIKMSDKVDMGEAEADTYVLLIEAAMPDTYEIFKVED